MQKYLLDGEWHLREAGTDKELSVMIPGSVLEAYTKAGLLPDPYYGENEKNITSLFEKEFEYRRSFTVAEELLAEDTVDLVCLGLDTLGDIILNGQKIASVNNMHRAWRFGVKSLLKKGENEIMIRFHSPNAFIRQAFENGNITYVNLGNMAGSGYLRKAHSQFGWDWGPQLPDVGIWRSIFLEASGTARIGDVYITQKHEKGRVDLRLKVRIDTPDRRHFWAEDRRLCGRIRISPPSGSLIEQQVDLDLDENTFSITIENPQLWWPNGLGAHPLYGVELELLSPGSEDPGSPLDIYRCKIGLRTMTISTEADQWGREFALMVNGLKVFSMGADYIPEDSIIPRVNADRTRKLLEDCVKANFNTIRVWGGGYYPDDFFYDLCDELGLVVWQDLMFACNIYVFTEDFTANVAEEVRQNIRRIRHHASLGLWCGNNEMEVAWVDWETVRDHPKAVKADYIKLFEVLLPQLARETDPNTFYWLASPSSGGSFDEPNADDRGDVHYWEVWHGLKSFAEYRKHYFRYCSEFGFEALPELDTIASFSAPEDHNLFSPVMEAHQKCPSGNGKILYYISETYRYPKDFASLVYISQILQMESIQYGVEHWRRYRGRCMGAIYWQLNDCWPVISWASIDYYGRWKALHYGARRFFAPLMVSIFNEVKNIRLFTHNETPEAVNGLVRLTLRDRDFRALASDEVQVGIPALSAAEVFARDYAELVNTAELERSVFVEAELLIDRRVVSRQTAFFAAPKAFSFKRPRYTLDLIETGDAFVIRLKADTFCRFVQLKISGEDVVFQDNYFDIVNSEGREILVLKSDLKDSYTAETLKGKVEILSVGDTY
ncbi:beta-mannosidase [Treponema primitia ZAS-2]|uniref:Beta-mannosidase B n=1 Tax=Treponema primitia (strain ATCC BAA-887 / DSM 12427 / ZAS-2) TaxID=545694 RepID=F5YNT8_TREPZ|nr:glycoside hydrolase family 2 protein [Treponema primitia]AEF85330.1 beta-mannosidase [Treponema primitia ZAS-2]